MKRFAIAAALCWLTVGGAAAQDWKDILGRAATAAADKLTGGRLTEWALVGTWNYTGPGVKFEGGDLLSEVGGSALESTVMGYLEKGYTLAGIKPGACSFSFDREKNFSAVVAGQTLSGTYEFDPSTHVVTLHFASGKFNLGTVPGHAYISGSDLQIVFPVTRLVELVTAIGSKVSALSTVASLLKKYENVYAGFAFSKAS